MNTYRTIVLATGVGLIVGLSVQEALSQRSNLDPTVLAPDIYESVFENDKVRVIKVTARDGSNSPIHSHPDRVLVYLRDCIWILENEDGAREEYPIDAGAIVWAEATTHGGQTNHVVDTCELFEVELK
jgi:hypothetical protein